MIDTSKIIITPNIKIMEKKKFYTRTTYGIVYKEGICYGEEEFLHAKHKALQEGIGIAVYERDVYTDGSMGEEKREVFLLGVTQTLSKAEAISLNKKENLGYKDFSRLKAKEFFYMAQHKALIAKDEATFALPYNFL